MMRCRFTPIHVVILASLLLERVGAETWKPPEPNPKQRDWVQLTSGEWLWGDIESFQDDWLTIDSEKLDDLMLDWDDVAVLRSARKLTYTFTDDRAATGTAVMQDSVIRVATPTGSVDFRRTDLLKIFEGGERELDFWSLKTSLGAGVRSGNSDQSDLNVLLQLQREAERTRFDLDYAGNYSKVGGVRTTGNQRLASTFDIIVTRGLFVTPFWDEIYEDEFQNIEWRYSIGAGGGYWVIRQKTLEWKVQLGGGYRETRQVSVEPGTSDRDQTGYWVPATSLDYDLTKDIDLSFGYSAQIGLPDPKDSTHHLQTMLMIDVFGDIVDLTGTFTWDRVESPRANASGVVPKRDDYRLVIGLGIDL